MFPTYRKLNEKCFFKIHDLSHFEEIKIMGNRYLFTVVKASQLPEKIYLQDVFESGLVITEVEYQNKLFDCKLNLKKI